MSRLKQTLQRLHEQQRKALIPYMTAGDPHPDHTVALMHALVRGGADVIELGVPFSDPMADGPVIQLACERALRHGTSLRRVLEMVVEFRRDDNATPVVLMGYLNPIETWGALQFAQRAQAAGVDGVLVVDLAVEEASELAACVKARDMDCVFLLAPTSDDTRIAAIAREASGYLYYVSLKGVTGSDRIDVDSVATKLAQIRKHTALPVAVGFGIRDAATAAQIGAVADAVIVGSMLVSEIERGQDDPTGLPQRLERKLRELRTALDSLELQS